MKHSKRILAYSAFALIVMLAVVAAIAPAASSVALAQTVPAAPDVSVTATTDTSITISWNAVDTAVTYQVQAYDEVGGHRGLSDVSAPTATITDSNLTTGRAYFYWVRAIDSDGGEGPWSARIDVIAGPAPATPSNLTGTGGFLQNSLTWDAVANADHYEVWGRLSSQANNYRELDLNREDTNYSHSGLTFGEDWYYWVRAVDSNGTKGLYAGPVVLTVLAQPTGGAPSNFQAARGDTQIVLTWGAPPSMTGVTITGYQFRHRESGGTWGDWTADTGDALTETVPGLTNGTAYDFEVRATTSVGTGTSASRSQTPATEPGVPTSFSATSTHNSVTLSWGAPADDGGAQVSSYRIEVLDGQSWSTRTTLPSNRTDYRHSSLDRATEYQYRIYATNAAGEGSAASTSILTLTSAPGVPGEPVALGVMVVDSDPDGGGAIDLSWQPPAFNGGSPILAYLYRYKVAEAADSTFVSWEDVGLELKDKVDGLSPGELYTFEVLARNSVGRGPAATVSTTSPVNNTPPTKAPTLTLSRTGNTTAGDDQFELEWNALGVADDGNSNDETLAITGYTLQWKSDPTYVDANEPDIDTSDYPEGDSGIQFLTVTSGNLDSGRKYSVVHSQISADNPLEPGTIYTYRVRAVSSVGDGEWSAERSLTTPDNAPDAPAAPTGKGLDPDTIEVKWEAPAFDGGADINRYELQVRTVNNMFMTSDATPVENSGNSMISNLPANRRVHEHHGVRTGVEYFYRVRAINSAGTSEWSPASDSDGISTDTAAEGTPGAPSNLRTTPPGTLPPTATDALVAWDAPGTQGDFPITSYELQYQRVDDNDVVADNQADIDDWSDAISVTPTPATSLMFTHKNIPGDAIFHYRVRAVSARGEGAWFPPDGTDFTLETDPRDPAMPVLTATATGMTNILLEWTVPDTNGKPITGYDLAYQIGDSTDWVAIDLDPADTSDDQGPAATDTLLDHSELASGTKYTYRIRAQPQTGDAGWSTDNPSATTQTGTPGRPLMFAADATDTPATDDGEAEVVGSITLTWMPPGVVNENDPVDDGGSDLTGYEIQILDTSTRTWVDEATVAADVSTYTDEDLEPGKTYYYILRAVNAEGAGAWTAFQSTTAGVGPPAVPVLTAESAGRNSINLSWTVPNNNGTPITGYQVQRTLETETISWITNVALRSDSNSDTLTVDTDTGLAAATKYYYRIRALTSTDAATAGDWSAEDDSTIGAASATTGGGAVPSVPRSPDADPGTEAPAGNGLDTVSFTWMAPADKGGSDITGYMVQRWNSDVNDWEVIGTPTAVGTEEETYVDRGLTRGKTYYYRVAAVNDEGTGPYTSPYVPETPTRDTTPNVPQNLTATALGPDSIRVTWDEPVPNGAAITGYVLQRWEFATYTDADPPAINTPARWREAIPISGAGTTIHTFTGLQPNTRYDFQISTASGTNSRFILAFAKTHIGAPGKPALTATGASETSIKLEWSLPANNGSPINHYEISMWDTTAKQWGWNGVADGVHNVQHPLRTFTHSGLVEGSQHIYRVRAVNDATNDNNGVGDWSTIVAGRTKAAE